MSSRTDMTKRTGWLTGLAAAIVLAMALLAGSSLATGMTFGSSWTGTSNWPEPLRSITQILQVESWPTYNTVEVRYVAWALAAVVLTILAATAPRHAPTADTTRPVSSILVGTCILLTVLVAIRATLSAVPVVGLVWTWQLALALLWMLLLYTWTIRTSIQTMGRAIAVSLGALCAITLLFCVQGRQIHPNWPVGNVLLLTTACLAGVFLAGTWTYSCLVPGWPEGHLRDRAPALVPAALSVLILVTLWMAGRRAGLLGLAAGTLFIAALTLWPRGGSRSPRWAKHIFPALMLVAIAVAAILIPQLYKAGRWESVLYRVEMYKATASILVAKPTTPLVGIGPNQLGFELTTRMRPLHAESPRLFHGEIADEAHSEPLQALVELGLPMGLLYLALPLGGLLGFARAYRKVPGQSIRLTILGAGAALAATMAAEATSVGMRRPGVAMLVWALAGMGWACGAQAGGFARLVECFQPVTRALATARAERFRQAASVLASLAVLTFAWQTLRAGNSLYQAQEARNRQQYTEVTRLLARAACVPTPGDWMAWKYLQAQASLMLMGQASSEPVAAPWRARALDALRPLVSTCSGYRHAPVMLSMATTDPAEKKTLCDLLLRYDPYDIQARLAQASYPDATIADQMQAMRLSIRNNCIDPSFSRLAAQVLRDPAAQQMLSRWLVDAGQALQQPDPARWSDPLALESLRIAVMLAGMQGKFPEALDRANQAAQLLKCLSTDSRRNRPEMVETEVSLDQAWFAWLLKPDSAPDRAAALEAHLQSLSEQTLGDFSRTMAAQFLAMLRLAQGQTNEANRALYLADPTIQPQALQTLRGQACARLVALLNTRIPPDQVQALARRGQTTLGDRAWQQALNTALSRGLVAWWFGVLTDE